MARLLQREASADDVEEGSRLRTLGHQNSSFEGPSSRRLHLKNGVQVGLQTVICITAAPEGSFQLSLPQPADEAALGIINIPLGVYVQYGIREHVRAAQGAAPDRGAGAWRPADDRGGSPLRRGGAPGVCDARCGGPLQSPARRQQPAGLSGGCRTVARDDAAP